MIQQNQMLVETMIRRMDAEERRRAEEEQKRKEEEEAAAKRAAEAVTVTSLDPFSGHEAASSSGSVPLAGTSTAGFSGNSAEKYLPPLPLVQHGEMDSLSFGLAAPVQVGLDGLVRVMKNLKRTINGDYADLLRTA